MKFKCGRSSEDERKYIDRQKKDKTAKELRNWHTIYAWLPHRVAANDCRWLEFVERRYMDVYVAYDCSFWWNPWVFWSIQKDTVRYRGLDALSD